MTDIAVRSVELPTGLRLPYAERGDPAGQPLLLLHGYTELLALLRSAAAAPARIAPRRRALHARPGRRGPPRQRLPRRGSSRGPRGFRGGARARLGSQVARCFAADHPGRVRGLVLVGAFASLRGNPAARALWDEAVSTLEDPIDPGFVRAFQESTIARPVPPALLETAVAESLKVPARIWREALAAQMEPDDSTPGGARIEAPALLLWGDQDAIATRADQDALAAAIPAARPLVYAGAGHAPHWEEPARVAADIAAFAAELARRARRHGRSHSRRPRQRTR